MFERLQQLQHTKGTKVFGRGGAGVQVFISDKRRRLCLPLATHISEYLGDPLDLTRLDSWDCVQRYCLLIVISLG